MESQQLLINEKGQGLLEYALLIMLIAIVVVGIVAATGGAIGNMYSSIMNQVPF
jgi:pilus assembly protein Flp/PilA